MESNLKTAERIYIDNARIKAAREKLGLTMGAAGTAAGFVKYPAQRWNEIERGKNGDIAVSTLVAIAKAMKRRPAHFIIRTEPGSVELSPTPKEFPRPALEL